MFHLRKALWSAAIFVVAATPAFAQSTRQRLDEVAERLDQLEQMVQGQALVELSQKVDTLNGEVRALRGEIEVLQNENAELRKQQAAALADFDRRLSSKPLVPVSPPSPASAETLPPPSATAPAVSESVTPEQRYGRAFDALKSGDYAAAITGMREFIAHHADHPLADNAYYWLGQTYYLNRDYAQAIDAFASVGSRSPDSAKAPDALLKRGLSELELKRTDAARRTLNEVVTRYPASEAARLAREPLQRLR